MRILCNCTGVQSHQRSAHGVTSSSQKPWEVGRVAGRVPSPHSFWTNTLWFRAQDKSYQSAELQYGSCLYPATEPERFPLYQNTDRGRSSLKTLHMLSTVSSALDNFMLISQPTAQLTLRSEVKRLAQGHCFMWSPKKAGIPTAPLHTKAGVPKASPAPVPTHRSTPSCTLWPGGS